MSFSYFLFLAVIFRVRDGLSGEVKQEYPQQSVIKGRQASAEATARRMDVNSASEVDTVEVATPRVEANASGSEVRLGASDTDSSSGNENNDIAASSTGIARGLGNG